MKKNTTVILAILLIGAILFGGWYVFINNKESGPVSNQLGSQTSDTDNKSVTPVALANNTVRFTTPRSWSMSKPGCVKDAPAYAGYNYLDSVSLIPGEKLPTIYGDGTEFFSVNVCAFKDDGQESLATWLEGAAGGLFASDTTSNESINNQEAYYRKRVESYEEVYYVLRKNQVIVLVIARTYEPGTLSDGTKVGNFRQYEVAIRNLAGSIQIN